MHDFRACLAWLWSWTPATLLNCLAKHTNSKTLWSSQLHGVVVQMRVEFWSTSFAAPKPPNMNLLMELRDNYQPMSLLSGKTVHFYSPRDPSLHRDSSPAPPSCPRQAAGPALRASGTPSSWPSASLEAYSPELFLPADRRPLRRRPASPPRRHHGPSLWCGSSFHRPRATTPASQAARPGRSSSRGGQILAGFRLVAGFLVLQWRNWDDDRLTGTQNDVVELYLVLPVSSDVMVWLINRRATGGVLRSRPARSSLPGTTIR
jgi:hypothetical protein